VRRRFVFSIIVPAFLAVLWCQGTALRATEQSVVRVAAATDLKFALDEIVDMFHVRHPNIKVQVTYGSSGNFYALLSMSSCPLTSTTRIAWFGRVLLLRTTSSCTAWAAS